MKPIALKIVDKRNDALKRLRAEIAMHTLYLDECLLSDFHGVFGSVTVSRENGEVTVRDTNGAVVVSCTPLDDELLLGAQELMEFARRLPEAINHQLLGVQTETEQLDAATAQLNEEMVTVAKLRSEWAERT